VKSNRLAILLVVMAALIVLRLVIPNSPTSVALAEPVARAARASTPAALANAARATPASVPAVDAEDDVPGNAFAVPVVAPPPAAPPPPVPPMVAVAAPALLAAQPVVASPPPPPPFQVIGSFDDGGQPAVFLATPSGTVMARAGGLPMPDWKVTSLTAQYVTLSQLSTQRNVQLPMPASQ